MMLLLNVRVSMDLGDIFAVFLTGGFVGLAAGFLLWAVRRG